MKLRFVIVLGDETTLEQTRQILTIANELHRRGMKVSYKVIEVPADYVQPELRPEGLR